MIIAHRGNLNGPDKQNENRPDCLIKAIRSGFIVETDIWFVDDVFYLGHDAPEYKVSHEFLDLIYPNCIFHCKNIHTFYSILNTYPFFHCFFHDSDACTLTSQKYIWTYPGQQLTPLSICVMPEFNDLSVEHIQNHKCAGVCTDYPYKYRLQ